MDNNKLFYKFLIALAVVILIMFATGNWFLAVCVMAVVYFIYHLVRSRSSHKKSSHKDSNHYLSEQYAEPIGPGETPDADKNISFMRDYSDKINDFFAAYPEVVYWRGHSLDSIDIHVKRGERLIWHTGGFTVSDDGKIEAFVERTGSFGTGRHTMFENADLKKQRESLAKARVLKVFESKKVNAALEEAITHLAEQERCTLNFHNVLDPSDEEYGILCVGSAPYLEEILSERLGENVKVKGYSPGIYRAEVVHPLHLKETEKASYDEIEGYLKTAKENIASGSPDAALSLCFKSVEIIVKILSRESGLPYDSREVPLIDMIDSLYSESVITEEQKKKLHRARSSGNIGKHTDLDNAVSDEEKMSRAKEAVSILEKLLSDFA